MKASETALLTQWQPAAQAVVDQLTDLFGARLVMGAADTTEGTWSELVGQLPIGATAVDISVQGDIPLTVVWAASDTSAVAAWLENDSVQEGLWEAILSGIATGLGPDFTVLPKGKSWAVTEVKSLPRVNQETFVLAWEASGDGVSLFLGFVFVSEAMRRLEQLEAAEAGEAFGSAVTAARAVSLPALEPEPAGTASRDLALIMDLPLRLTVEIGSARLLIKDVLALGTGSVVELNRLAGEPVDVLVNGKLLAKGEIVVLPDGNFGVRVLEIINANDRLSGLGTGR